MVNEKNKSGRKLGFVDEKLVRKIKETETRVPDVYKMISCITF